MALQSNAAQLNHDHSGSIASISVGLVTNGALAVNDTQTVALTGTVTSGSFTLTLGGYGTTTSIAYNASASTVQSAIAGITAGPDIVVGGSNGGPWVCVFQGGLADTPLSTMTYNASGLVGGGSVSVAHNIVGNAGASNAQLVSLNGGPTGGTWTLTFNGYTTGALGYNAIASTVHDALVALTSIGAGNVTVTGSTGGPYTVTFAGSLANSPQNQMTATSSLTGGLFATQKLEQVNTHQLPDTDLAVISLHHTLGPGATQAAPGNHAHDYEGPSIYNKPYIICTSTTRPTNPQVGLTIFETDTGCWRCWGSFNPNNVVAAGIYYSYSFTTRISPAFLDDDIWDQDYVVGFSPDNGTMGCSESGVCVWAPGSNVPCRCIAQGIVEDFNIFNTDDHQITITIGEVTFGDFGSGGKFNPTAYEITEFAGRFATNDLYLRMSLDRSSYVRFSILNSGVSIFCTTSGPDGEAFLGGCNCALPTEGTVVLCKSIGDTHTIYFNGVQIVSVVDYLQIANRGSDYRCWGIGMGATEGLHSQYVPLSITEVVIQDIPQYSTELIWQLLNIGAVPHLRAEQRYQQEVFVTTSFFDVLWFFVVADWHVRHFIDIEISNTDITIQEAGSYSVHASIAWHPDYYSFDHAAVAVVVNGQDIGRKNWEFVRGNGFAPGFAQTNEIFFTYYFAQGDVVHIQASNNCSAPCYFYYHSTPPYVQTSYVELDFLSPT